MQLKLASKAKLPTPWGNFLIVGFEEFKTKRNHIALVYGNISKKKSVLVRIHSECLTGDAFFSLRCDCGLQLQSALNGISKNGYGILLYHRQEGRNIGLLNKIAAYALQDIGYNTIEANHKLGFAADARDFTVCADMLKLLNVNSISLMTNNPLKINILLNSGINVTERVPLIVPYNEKNIFYLQTKAKSLGHVFPNIIKY